MTGGITPIDNAFDLIGLQQCSALMRYIFIETLAGKVIFLLGFLLSLARSLKSANFRSVIVFCSLFFSCLLLLVIPKTELRLPLSTMEEQGFNQLTTDAILRKCGIDQIVASPVIAFIGETASAFSNGAVAVMDLAHGHNARFLQAPFITAKLWLISRERLKTGVSDPGVKARLVVFYQDHVFMTERKLLDSGSIPLQPLWPGAQELLAEYSSEEASEWRILEDDLYQGINSDGLFDRVARDYYDGGSLKDAAVRALIEEDAAHTPLAYTMQSFSGRREIAREQGVLRQVHAPGLIDRVSHAWLSGFPLMYGACQWSVWAAFPFVLIFLLLSADLSILLYFLKYMLILKLLPLLWALIDRVSMVVFDIQTLLSGGKVWLWEMPLVGLAVWPGMAVLPFMVLMLLKRKDKT